MHASQILREATLRYDVGNPPQKAAKLLNGEAGQHAIGECFRLKKVHEVRSILSKWISTSLPNF